MRVRVSTIPWGQADLVLLGASLSILALGTVLVVSATWRYPDQPSLLGNPWIVKQLAFLVLGLAAMVACALVRPGVLLALALPAYVLSIFGLLAVSLVGTGATQYGAYAQRWIEVMGVQLQPSEPAKVALVLALARVLGQGSPGFGSLVASAGLTVVPVVLVYLEPDLGTALTMLAIWVGMVVLAGIAKGYVVGIGVLGIASMPVLWVTMREYMRQRILTFLNPEAYALGEGYNILQAQISIGSGGMWGKGLLEGTQTQLRYLRLSHSDFIFSVLGEELGFVGAMTLLLLFLLVLFRLFGAHDNAEGRFGALLCGGVGSMIAFQVMANIGGNVGLTPPVGIPLPLVSYGGSALMSQLAALGLVQGALMAKRPYRAAR